MDNAKSNLFYKIMEARKKAGITTPIQSTLTEEQRRIVESLKPGEQKTVDGITYCKED